jgi:AbrB family looped-hinge helix DNA binding protein
MNTSASRATKTTGNKQHLSAVSRKGQATIPADIRREAGILPGDVVHFSFEDGRIIVKKTSNIDVVWNTGQSAMLNEWNNKDEDIYND